MNWLPNIPTDSLHKYLALNGLWFVFGILALLAFLHYQNYEYQEFNKKQSWLISKQDAVKRFKTRIDSINKRHFDENVIPEISHQFKPKEEIIFLKNAISLNEEDITKLSKQIDEPPKSLLPLLEYFYVEKILIVSLIFGLILACSGFKSWIKTQRLSDEIQRHDLELKRLQLAEAKRARFKRKG